MIVLFAVLLFSKSNCLLVLFYVYWHVLRASTRRVQRSALRSDPSTKYNRDVYVAELKVGLQKSHQIAREV